MNIKKEFHPNKWIYVQGPIYSISGLLIIVYSLVFHILYVNLNFITFCNVFVLFNLGCLLFWLLTNYKNVIYIFRRY